MQKKKKTISENSFLEAYSQCHPFNFKAESQIKRQCVPVMFFFFFLYVLFRIIISSEAQRTFVNVLFVFQLTLIGV